MGILPWHGPLVQLRPLRPWPFAVEPADEHLYCKQKKESFIPGSLDTTITTAAPRRAHTDGGAGGGCADGVAAVILSLELSSHTTSRCWLQPGVPGVTLHWQIS